jgi:hypothetical protein
MTQNTRKLVIVGAGIAGLRAAMREPVAIESWFSRRTSEVAGASRFTPAMVLSIMT